MIRPTDALWTRYRAHHDPDARAQLLDSYLGLVHHSARELVRRVSHHLELDDLVSAGTVGLVQALEGFDPGRGLAFSTYAMPRIRGAMLDELRQRDWMPRTARARSRRIAQVLAELQQKLGRSPGAPEMAEALEVDLPTYFRWVRECENAVMLPLDHLSGEGDESESRLFEIIPDRALRDPGDVLTQREQLDELRRVFSTLPDKDRLVLTLYYYEDLNLRQIGEVLHITESRVSQIRTRALGRLRGHLCAEREAS